MNLTNLTKWRVLLLLLSTLTPKLSTCLAQGTAFTYQGFLTDNGAPASAVYDVRFTLFDAVGGGAIVGSPVDVNDAGVTNGLFTVTLDFGGSVFNGPARWLNIAVRPGPSTGAYTNLVPRQAITATPYAVSAQDVSGVVAATQLTGTVADARLSTNIPRLNLANTFTAAQSVSVSGQTTAALTSSNTGGAWLNVQNTAAGGRPWNLIASGPANGEGAGKLLVRDATANAVRMTFDTDGDVGIGTASPGAKLELAGADTALRVRNVNDPGGGFLLNSWSTLQLGLFNAGATTWGAIPASGTRSLFGVENTGRVGTLTNTGGQPVWRNVLDDGSGNTSITGNLSANNLPAIKEARTIRDARTQAAWVVLNGGFQNFDTLTVNVPASGQLLVQGEAQLIIYSDLVTPVQNVYVKIEEVLQSSTSQLLEENASVSGGDVRTSPVARPSTVIPTTAGQRTFRLVVTDSQAAAQPVYVGTTAIRVTYFPGTL